MARTVIPTADLKKEKRIVWKSEHGRYDINFFFKQQQRERKRKREIMI